MFSRVPPPSFVSPPTVSHVVFFPNAEAAQEQNHERKKSTASTCRADSASTARSSTDSKISSAHIQVTKTQAFTAPHVDTPAQNVAAQTTCSCVCSKCSLGSCKHTHKQQRGKRSACQHEQPGPRHHATFNSVLGTCI